jgi:rubrerythrin
VYEQGERRYLNGKWVEYPPSTILLGGNCKVVLARPRPSKDNFHNEIRYVILTVLTVSKDDRAEALKARELDEPIKIFDHGLLPAGNVPNNLYHNPRDITTSTPEPAPSAPAPPEAVRAAPRERPQQLNTKQHRTPTSVQQLLDRIQRGATVYFCRQTSDIVATNKTGAPCETCKQPTTFDTHPRVKKVLRRGKANTPYYCEITGCLIVGDETTRYCELCGEPNSTHRLNPITTQTPKPQHAEKETTTAPKENEDKQRFIITPQCPQCNTSLVPNRGLYCPHCNHKLPPELAIHPEVVVAIKRKDYDKLATHLKQATNVAWNQLLKGRKVAKTINSMGQNMFIITVQDENRTSTLADEQKFDSILTDTGIGRLTTDPYELREAHRMTDRKPPAQST